MTTQDIVAEGAKFPLLSVGAYAIDADGRRVLDVPFRPIREDEDGMAQAIAEAERFTVWVVDTLNAEARHLGII